MTSKAEKIKEKSQTALDAILLTTSTPGLRNVKQCFLTNAFSYWYDDGSILTVNYQDNIIETSKY